MYNVCIQTLYLHDLNAPCTYSNRVCMYKKWNTIKLSNYKLIKYNVSKINLLLIHSLIDLIKIFVN